MEWTPNKSQHIKLTLEKKILPPLLPGFELATFRSRGRRSYQQAISVMTIRGIACTKHSLVSQLTGRTQRFPRRLSLSGAKKKKKTTQTCRVTVCAITEDLLLFNNRNSTRHYKASFVISSFNFHHCYPFGKDMVKEDEFLCESLPQFLTQHKEM